MPSPSRSVAQARRGLALAAATLVMLAPEPAGGVIISSGDGTGNTTTPARDPGWGNVARRGKVSAVYLGDGWMLTANHVGSGGVTLGGRRYPADLTVRVQLRNPDCSYADLALFRLHPDAGLPDRPPLEIARKTPRPGTHVILAGNGRNRGKSMDWTRPSGDVLRGWRWGAGQTLRWGTNLIDRVGSWVEVKRTRTRGLFMKFRPPEDPLATEHESQVSTGDSGGALFADVDGEYVLAGILFSRETNGSHPEKAALFGDRTIAADLASYRDQIEATIDPLAPDSPIQLQCPPRRAPAAGKRPSASE